MFVSVLNSLVPVVGLGNNQMKKIALAAAALAIGTVSASAADLAARPYTKAPVAAPIAVYNWTGFYIGGMPAGARMNATASPISFRHRRLSARRRSA